jgi:hypothetical protein
VWIIINLWLKRMKSGWEGMRRRCEEKKREEETRRRCEEKKREEETRRAGEKS